VIVQRISVVSGFSRTVRCLNARLKPSRDLVGRRRRRADRARAFQQIAP